MGKLANLSCLGCLKRSEIFNSLIESELEMIDCHRVSVNYSAGEILFKQGTPCYNFTCITSGMVKLYIEHDDHHKTIVGLVRPVDYIFVPGAYVDQRHHFTAVACEPTTACLIDTHIFRDLVRLNPQFANDFITKLSNQAIALLDRISGFSHKHIFGRMAETLLYLANHIYKSNIFDLTLSRQDLADLSDMTKESAIRVLKKFKDDGIIRLESNHIEIINTTMLESVSRTG